MRRLQDIRWGDRFQSGNWIVEAVNPKLNKHFDNRFYSCTVVQGEANFKHYEGTTRGFWILGSKSSWTFIGNYNKTSNFEQLYNLLNQ